jgi:SCF-associated factor 1
MRVSTVSQCAELISSTVEEANGYSGWSTTVLTSKGTLHTAGVLDGQRILYTNPASDRLHTLQFPPAYHSSATAAYEEPTTAIRQFSAGRSHILGLSDSGRMWAWADVQTPALQIKFANVDIEEILSNESAATRPSLYGRVKQVVAGWSCSSAYIYGTGILLWEPVRRGPNDQESDTMLVLQNFEVPKTNYQRIKGAGRESDYEKALGEEVGAVLNYIIMENYVVFVTDIGRVFCSRLGSKNKVDEILELRALRNEKRTTIDVQGSFRRFAIFKNGEVIIVDQEYLDSCWERRTTDSEQADIGGIQLIPALQHNDVISVAFGDYHFLALHSTGKITTYGTELQSCGALGLGCDGESEGRLRGIVYDTISHHGVLLPHALTHGRQIWFRPQQKEWLKFLIDGGKDPEEAKERLQLFTSDRRVQGEVSEWIEQEGREWDKDVDEDGLGAYFALRVSAAGWQSGAVIMVNDELANKPETYDWRDKSFPRLKLSNGRDMEGTVSFDEWREARPEWPVDIDVEVV